MSNFLLYSIDVSQNASVAIGVILTILAIVTVVSLCCLGVELEMDPKSALTLKWISIVKTLFWTGMVFVAIIVSIPSKETLINVAANHLYRESSKGQVDPRVKDLFEKTYLNK